MSNREIDARVSAFVSELETLIRTAALEARQMVAGGGAQRNHRIEMNQ